MVPNLFLSAYWKNYTKCFAARHQKNAIECSSTAFIMTHFAPSIFLRSFGTNIFSVYSQACDVRFCAVKSKKKKKKNILRPLLDLIGGGVANPSLKNINVYRWLAIIAFVESQQHDIVQYFGIGYVFKHKNFYKTSIGTNNDDNLWSN